jgi:hypothetical protein
LRKFNSIHHHLRKEDHHHNNSYHHQVRVKEDLAKALMEDSVNHSWSQVVLDLSENVTGFENAQAHWDAAVTLALLMFDSSREERGEESRENHGESGAGESTSRENHGVETTRTSEEREIERGLSWELTEKVATSMQRDIQWVQDMANIAGWSGNELNVNLGALRSLGALRRLRARTTGAGLTLRLLEQSFHSGSYRGIREDLAAAYKHAHAVGGKAWPERWHPDSAMDVAWDGAAAAALLLTRPARKQ